MANNLSQIRGNPQMEKAFGAMMSGVMPALPPTGAQTIQGGKGQSGKLGIGHGFNKATRFGLLSEGMTSFLSRYAGGLKYGDLKPVISTQDLLKM